MNFQAQQFTYVPETKTYVAEASELGLPVGMTHSSVTIDGYAFAYVGVDWDASGEDVAGWRYKATMGTVQKSPVFAGTTVLIIND